MNILLCRIWGSAFRNKYRRACDNADFLFIPALMDRSEGIHSALQQISAS